MNFLALLPPHPLLIAEHAGASWRTSIFLTASRAGEATTATTAAVHVDAEGAFVEEMDLPELAGVTTDDELASILAGVIFPSGFSPIPNRYDELLAHARALFS